MIGFGRSAHVDGRHILESERAVLFEIVDEDARPRVFLANLRDLPVIALITLEAVEIIDVHAMKVPRDGEK